MAARFDVGKLRELAGDKVFARGETYYRDGSVSIIRIDNSRVLSQVAGTEDYRCELAGRGKRIEGACSCPAFEGFGFCKHLVATALTANSASPEAEAEGSATLDRIKRHLREKGVERLVELVIELAEQDAELFRKLDLAATAQFGDAIQLGEQLRKALDSAVRTRGHVDYADAREWAAGIRSVLKTIEPLASGSHGALAMQLAERAIESLRRAQESVDDSDGHCGALVEYARDIHAKAAISARPEPVSLARKLYKREMEDDLGFFAGSAEYYSEALGETGLAEYRRLATEAWEKLPPVGSRARTDVSYQYDQLKGILDFFAQRDGDNDARIALRTKDLASPWSYLQLAELCRELDREDDALKWAEEGLWIFEDDEPDNRLVFFATELLCKKERKDDAVAQLWRVFERSPDGALYDRLRKLAGLDVCAHAIRILEQHLSAKDPRRAWHDTELLIEILLKEKMLDEAWKAVYAHGCSTGTKEKLVRATEKTHTNEALAFYKARVEVLARTGGDPSYKQAAGYVKRLSTLQNASEHAAYVADLRLRFARRRTFVPLLG
ncbi:MAG TPA: SWIM zinc finger family protein [Rhizomicrobium sp.]|nr:SWIM zinc finger family protein [Rhizomicrobium sp.]